MTKLWPIFLLAGVLVLLLAPACTDDGDGDDATGDVHVEDTMVSDTTDTSIPPGDDTVETADEETSGDTVQPEPQSHRAVAEPCDDERPPGDPWDIIEDPECASDEDCQDGLNGRCSGLAGGIPYNQCTYDECLEDADCGGFACACNGGWQSDHNVCTTAGTCLTDADCGTDGYCSLSVTLECAAPQAHGYFCRTPDDQCLDDADCSPTGDAMDAVCAYDTDLASWRCFQGEPCP